MAEKKKYLKIKVKKEIVEYGGGFYDPYSKKKIYPKKASEILIVEDTPFIRQKIGTGEIELVEEKQEKDQNKGKSEKAK